jgi:hypothetical protein
LRNVARAQRALLAWGKFHLGDKNIGMTPARLIPSTHVAIPLAITLALLAKFFLVETSLPQLPTIQPPSRAALVIVMTALNFDTPRSNLNSL